MQAHVPRSSPRPHARAHMHAGSPTTRSHTRVCVHGHGWAAAPGAYPRRSPVLARRPLAQLAEVLVQPGAARAAQPQHQRQPQQRAQQQGGGQGAPPCREPHVSARLCPAPPRAAQSPILLPAAPSPSSCPHLAPVWRRGRCPGCPPLRGSRRWGVPSPAHSGSGRGCCTPGWMTPSLSPQLLAAPASPPGPQLTPCPWHLLRHCWSPSTETSWHWCWRHTCGGTRRQDPCARRTPPAPPRSPHAHLPGAAGCAGQHHGCIAHVLDPGQHGSPAGALCSAPTGTATPALQPPAASIPVGTEGQGHRQQGWGQ